MSTKNFCDVCKKEIKDRGYMVWTSPTKHYCKECWFDEKKWPIIHKFDKDSVS